MTQPPAGSSLLFGALADSGKIKQRKNSSYRMVLKGVESINWFTDRPPRAEGTWKPQKLLRKWDKYFASSEPNAQAGFRAEQDQEMATFEMFKPKIKSGKMIFNIKPLTDSGEDKLTGLQGKDMSDISLFIDDAYRPTGFGSGLSSCLPNCSGADLKGQDLYGANLSGANLSGANLTGANLNYAHLFRTYLYGAKLVGADLSYAVLNSADLSFANLTQADLTNANLTGANLKDADLNHSILNGNLKGANLTNANLNGAYLGGATYNSATIWPTAEYWNDTTCPDGTNSDNNPSCGF